MTNPCNFQCLFQKGWFESQKTHNKDVHCLGASGPLVFEGIRCGSLLKNCDLPFLLCRRKQMANNFCTYPSKMLDLLTELQTTTRFHTYLLHSSTPDFFTLLHRHNSLFHPVSSHQIPCILPSAEYPGCHYARYWRPLSLESLSVPRSTILRFFSGFFFRWGLG